MEGKKGHPMENRSTYCFLSQLNRFIFHKRMQLQNRVRVPKLNHPTQWLIRANQGKKSREFDIFPKNLTKKKKEDIFP